MRVVGLGGGHGLAATLRAARLYADEITAVVTVADDGGSSGRLTRELGIPPPGDIRNCLAALARNADLAAVYQHRFASGLLTGHAVGNLVIASLTEMHGDFGRAVQAAGLLLDTLGDVFPATTELVRLGARVEGGIVRGQVAVARTEVPIQEVYLEPAEPAAYEPAAEAIRRADQVVLGPGSLYTSLIATLLVPGIGRAVRETAAVRAFVCNSRMQKGETDGLTATEHVRAVAKHLGEGHIDVVIVQNPVLAIDGVAIDDGLRRLNLNVLEGDVTDDAGAHRPENLAELLRSLPSRMAGPGT